MNGAHSRRPNRLFNGRIEKRFPTSVPVYLASLEEPRSRERTLTENVSPHGARVISQRFWQSGEESLITPLTGEFRQVGRVIYCLPTAGDGCRERLIYPRFVTPASPIQEITYVINSNFA